MSLPLRWLAVKSVVAIAEGNNACYNIPMPDQPPPDLSNTRDATAAERRALAAEVASARRELAERRAALKATRRTYRKDRSVPPPVHLTMRLPALDYAALNALAAAANVTLSEFVRDVLAGRRPPITHNP